MSNSLDRITVPHDLFEDFKTASSNQNDDRDTIDIASERVKDINSQSKSEQLEKYEQQQLEQKFKWENIRFNNKRIFVWLTTGVGVVLPCVYLWHLLMPESRRWLSPSDVQSIKDLAVTILTGVTVSIGAALTLGDREKQK